MKRTAPVLGLVLFLAGPANAVLTILADGRTKLPGSELWLNRGDEVILEVRGDGTTPEPLEGYFFVEGPGSINGHTLAYPGTASEYGDLEDAAEAMEMTVEETLAAYSASTGRDLSDLSKWVLADDRPAHEPLEGSLIDDIVFRCEGDGDVLLTLETDDEWTTYPDYTIVIHQTAEIRTYYVDANGGDDGNTGLSPDEAFATIQKAVDSAYDGETIVVQPGRYLEDINFLGKNIVLRSTDPNDSTVVQQTVIGGDFRLGEQEAVVTFRGAEDPSCRLSGFDINGYIRGSDPLLDPGAENHTHATISNCTLCNNQGDCGAVIMLCEGLIEHCVLAGNNVYACGSIDAALDGCGGLIRNCTFANNRTRYAIRVSPGGIAKIESCILDDSDVFIDLGGSAEISYTDLQGYAFEVDATTIVLCDFNDRECASQCDGLVLGPGIISTDPCFVRVGDGSMGIVGDYHVKSRSGRWDPHSGAWVIDAVSSRCIDAGCPGSPPGDEPPSPLNKRINMGAYGGTAEASKTPVLWSRLADLTNDGIVDAEDYAHQAKDLYISDGQRPGDLNRDGVVHFDDVAILVGEWLDTTIWH